MIIFRYLARDLVYTTLAVTAVLFTIFLTSKFSSYLDQAAQGKLSVDILFTLIGYRMTSLLELILPLGFYLAILLAYGRMYMESEMVVLFACGTSPGQLMRLTLIPAGVIALIVGVFSFWLSPIGAQYAEKIFTEQRNRSEFDSLQEGRFQSLGGGKVMTYVESMSSNRKQLQNVFVAQADSANGPSILVAESGSQAYFPEYGQQYLILHKGYRYEGRPGSADFSITRFEDWGRYMPPQNEASETVSLATDAKSTLELIAAKDRESIATLQWRLSMPLMVLIGALLAVPLSKTNPRQGRYLKMLPAILVYVFYLAFLINARSALVKGNLNPQLGVWVVHIPFFLMALLMLNWHSLTHARAKRVEVVSA